MRSSAFAAAIALVFVGTAPALAAPTCQTSVGDTIRCGAPGAMPVGWRLPDRARLDRQMSEPSGPGLAGAASLICLVGALFALLALMPRFDGGWDRQEGDEE